ncbi:MAG: hypothetical protein WBQ37_12520, partial [Candidatus Competibacter sp.]
MPGATSANLERPHQTLAMCRSPTVTKPSIRMFLESAAAIEYAPDNRVPPSVKRAKKSRDLHRGSKRLPDYLFARTF